MGKESVIKE